MLTLFGKKKITEEKVAKIVVNGILEAVENGFSDVAALINSDPDFVSPPSVSVGDDQNFLLIVIAGNLKMIPQYFESGQDKRLEESILSKFATVFEMDPEEFKNLIEDYKSYLSRVNYPSKKTLYAMSKAVFFKYELNPHQEDYFKNMNTPNPLFLKRMDDIMENFLWGWNAFLEKYKVQPNQ